MKVVVLTSSRADYSIYYPLLRRLQSDAYFDLSLIAFGSHLSTDKGYTLQRILDDGFDIAKAIATFPDGDMPVDIAQCTGETVLTFCKIWEAVSTTTDLIICLGDRFEMFAAATASVPFNIPIAHIHGGETTTGAIDNIYRHALTHMSSLHFASTENHANRIKDLIGSVDNVFNVGALGIEALTEVPIMTASEFDAHFSIPIDEPVLVTFHPETVGFERNSRYADELITVLKQVPSQVIITMPNMDTSGNMIRTKLQDFANTRDNVFTVESLGLKGYYSSLSRCKYVLGNSSSGIIEAASFGKYVINIGNRQKGRDHGPNVLHCPIEKDLILDAIQRIGSLKQLDGDNIYYQQDTSRKIINAIKGWNK